MEALNIVHEEKAAELTLTEELWRREVAKVRRVCESQACEEIKELKGRLNQYEDVSDLSTSDLPESHPKDTATSALFLADQSTTLAAPAGRVRPNES